MFSDSPIPPDPTLIFFLERFVFFRGVLHMAGWAFHPEQEIREIGWQLPGQPCQWAKAGVLGVESPDVAAYYGERAARCRFRQETPAGGKAPAMPDGRLVFTLADGRRVAGIPWEEAADRQLKQDPYHRLQGRFFSQVRQQPSPRVLEVGSRNRSGNVRRKMFPAGSEYVGLDILPGGNVDVVGDAHALSSLFAPASFDAVLSMSVFEHLLMPWKAVLEMNKVLKPGGLALITTHQTTPLHELPWDFFRFSDQAWHGLFNRFTGFEILETALGEPAAIVPLLLHRVVAGLEDCPAFIGSAVLARKTGETTLAWPVDLTSIIDSTYPLEETGGVPAEILPPP